MKCNDDCFNCIYDYCILGASLQDQTEYKREYYKKNKEKFIERAVKWKAEHPEAVKRHSNRHYELHKEEINRKHRAYMHEYNMKRKTYYHEYYLKRKAERSANEQNL